MQPTRLEDLLGKPAKHKDQHQCFGIDLKEELKAAKGKEQFHHGAPGYPARPNLMNRTLEMQGASPRSVLKCLPGITPQSSRVSRCVVNFSTA